jgi:hypothetical protein
MSASKRPSTSSLRRFITSRPYVTVAELRRRFGLDDPDAMALLRRNGTSAWIGLPEREAAKLQELWNRDELGIELSVEVQAPVAVGVYPMRIARYVMDGPGANGIHPSANGHVAGPRVAPSGSPAHGSASVVSHVVGSQDRAASAQGSAASEGQGPAFFGSGPARHPG